MAYNAMYERLVDGSSNPVQGYIAYGLYKSAKREWVRQSEAEKGRPPRAPEVKGYVDAYTPQMRDVFEAQAAGVLAEFADGAISGARPGIVEQALRGTTWRAVWQAITANAIYTLLLIALVVILERAGIDILSIAVGG